MFSNPADKARILVEGKGQICPMVLLCFLNLSPWIGEQCNLKMKLQLYSRIADKFSIPGVFLPADIFSYKYIY